MESKILPQMWPCHYFNNKNAFGGIAKYAMLPKAYFIP